jgi:5-(carboxyamino)imidazole ribonucleotide synthase
MMFPVNATKHILRTSRFRRQRQLADKKRNRREDCRSTDYVGVIGIEMFVAGKKVVNDRAARPNSGHWTMDACLVSQFEQHMRAVAGWPLGNPARHSNAVMTNLLGDEAKAWVKLAAEPAAAVHLYGKAEARRGRKMGHVNRLTPRQT